MRVELGLKKNTSLSEYKIKVNINTNKKWNLKKIRTKVTAHLVMWGKKPANFSFV